MMMKTAMTPADWGLFLNRHAERFAHLSARPGAKRLSLDDMETLTGVGHTTLSKIRTGLYAPRMVDIAERLLALDDMTEDDARQRLGAILAEAAIDEPDEDVTDWTHGLSVGDVVRLRSDGPEMTVNAVSEETKMMICMWFAMPQMICMVGGFAPQALKIVRSLAEIERPQLGKVSKLRPVDAV